LKEKTKQQVIDFIGYSDYHSEFDIWKYEPIKNLIFKREIIIFFIANKVYDIIITDYLLGTKLKERIY